MQPLYNRLLRRKKEIVLLLEEENDQGYRVARAERVKTIEPDLINRVIGVFESERRCASTVGLLAQNHELCLKLLGQERGSNACFGSQIGSCRRACVGDELPVAYNLRFMSAFGRSKIRPWLASGPIVYTEENSAGLREQFVIDKWCLLARQVLTSDSQTVTADLTATALDVDTYRILSRHLLSPAAERFMKPLFTPVAAARELVLE